MLYTVRHEFPGRLSTMAHPSGGDELSTEMTSLRTQGVDVLVSALTEGEQIDLALLGEPEAAAAAGIEFHTIPIGDFGVPDRAAVMPTLTLLSDKLRDGSHVVAHCWGGIGRSSVLAASLLVLNGVAADDAWSLISTARGRAVPETEDQRAWITGFPRFT